MVPSYPPTERAGKEIERTRRWELAALHYVPDFLIRLRTEAPCHLILETKGCDELAEVKRAAALRWVAAVNADGAHGHWQFEMVRRVPDVNAALTAALERARAATNS
jgi:type III restriction enzyme